jgi:hypothetical protein
MVDLVSVGLQLLVEQPDGIVDVFELGVALQAEVFVDVYFDAGRAEGEQALLGGAEVCEGLVAVEGAGELGEFGAGLVAGVKQTGSHE